MIALQLRTPNGKRSETARCKKSDVQPKKKKKKKDAENVVNNKYCPLYYYIEREIESSLPGGRRGREWRGEGKEKPPRAPKFDIRYCAFSVIRYTTTGRALTLYGRRTRFGEESRVTRTNSRRANCLPPATRSDCLRSRSAVERFSRFRQRVRRGKKRDVSRFRASGEEKRRTRGVVCSIELENRKINTKT